MSSWDNWIDRDLVVYSLERLKRGVCDDQKRHPIIVETVDATLSSAIEMVKRLPPKLVCPDKWREKDD